MSSRNSHLYRENMLLLFIEVKILGKLLSKLSCSLHNCSFLTTANCPTLNQLISDLGMWFEAVQLAEKLTMSLLHIISIQQCHTCFYNSILNCWEANDIVNDFKSFTLYSWKWTCFVLGCVRPFSLWRIDLDPVQVLVKWTTFKITLLIMLPIYIKKLIQK